MVKVAVIALAAIALVSCGSDTSNEPHPPAAPPSEVSAAPAPAPPADPTPQATAAAAALPMAIPQGESACSAALNQAGSQLFAVLNLGELVLVALTESNLEPTNPAYARMTAFMVEALEYEDRGLRDEWSLAVAHAVAATAEWSGELAEVLDEFDSRPGQQPSVGSLRVAALAEQSAVLTELLAPCLN